MINAHDTLLLDLDRTLFDTPRFVDSLWSWIGDAYAIDAAAQRARMKDYFSYVDEMYNYDFFAHIRDLGIDQRALIAGAHDALSGEDFLYDDAKAFLLRTARLDRTILTFGGEAYQQFKISFCPGLQGIPVHATLEPKQRTIAQYWPDKRVVWIDDKPHREALPDGVRFILLDRAQMPPVDDHGSYTSVRSLDDVRFVN